MLGRKGQIHTFKVTRTEEEQLQEQQETDYYKFNKSEVLEDDEKEHIKNITYGADIKDKVLTKLKRAHSDMSEVFNESLDRGYNHYYGKHECRLNWAGENGPQSNKPSVVNYKHTLNGLLQEVADNLTRQGVPADPQELGISVQAVCPAFLQRKKRAKDKIKDQLTMNDVMLLVNFRPFNKKIKDVPTQMMNPDDVFNLMGWWKYIIVMDLYHGFFQNHMSSDSVPWLAIMTPFGGVRVMMRSGQGLLGQSEEFTLLIKIIIKEDLQEGKCCQIINDIITGGATQEEAEANFIAIIKKFQLANIKVFPKQIYILGWVWKQGG